MFFRKLALKSAQAVGSAPAFLLAVVVTLAWIATGPYFHYSDTWQLVINTATSVATFLIVFLIQNTQNRDTAVIQLKLDELIRAVTQARTELVQNGRPQRRTAGRSSRGVPPASGTGVGKARANRDFTK
jgi:low affinity Fe/Cu permease